jgi:hypothetical protein
MDDHDLNDHYREGLYRILRGDANPREIAASYLGEESPHEFCHDGTEICSLCGYERSVCEAVHGGARVTGPGAGI